MNITISREDLIMLLNEHRHHAPNDPLYPVIGSLRRQLAQEADPPQETEAIKTRRVDNDALWAPLENGQ